MSNINPKAAALFSTCVDPYTLMTMLDINRGLMVVKPKQPFLDWLRSIDEAELKLDLEKLRTDTSAYLVPEWEYDADRMEILEWCVESVFAQELWGWYTDEALWPARRDLATFLEWFDVEFHCLVFDVDDATPLEYIDYSSEESTDIDPNSNGH